mmetsp:Transcript_74212/g.211798  ORF Transcript_74212/g.211798 Transcript_74212/m.211798 type:complete len:197 (-) Transcript_74212:26-616(-)
MHGDMEMQAPDRYGHFPPPPGSFGEGGGPKYGTGVRAFDDVPDSWRPIPTGPIEERRATYTAIKLSAFFFAVPALICMYGLVVLHRMSAREATGPDFGQPQALDGPKAMDSPSVSVWEEEEKGTIVFAELANGTPPSAMQVQAQNGVSRNGAGGLRGASKAVASGEVGERSEGQVGTDWEPQWTQRGWTAEAPSGA